MLTNKMLDFVKRVGEDAKAAVTSQGASINYADVCSTVSIGDVAELLLFVDRVSALETRLAGLGIFVV